MKKVLLSVIFFAFAANVSAQLKVDATGNTRVTKDLYLGGSFISGTSTVPITLKVNDILAGYTGAAGKYNVSFGYRALSSSTTGSNNTANGWAALCYNTTGSNNTANGAWALYDNTTGSHNTANGNDALANNTTGSYNTAIGYYALCANKTGSYNTATGYRALYNNTASNNTASGIGSLYANTTGIGNAAIGYYALESNTTGSYNTASGQYALESNTTGSYNTAMGFWADVNANNLSNTTAIGYDATVTSSNQVRIGNSSVTSIGGYAGWTNLSDGRAKKNIRTDVPGLEFVKLLQPVTYNLDLDAVDGLLKIDRAKISGRDEVEQPMSQELTEINKKAKEAKEKRVQTGFVAQDVEKAAQSIGYDFSGVDVDETGIYGLRYAEFVVPLVKAVQELSEQNDRLQAQINELTELVSTLQGKDADPTQRSATTAESVLTK
jgi:hypothetical protein